MIVILPFYNHSLLHFSAHKPAFIFIANLALADAFMVAVEFVTAHLQWTSHREPDPDHRMDFVDMVRTVKERFLRNG